jgi:membrane complex biogenesis BtpA family protein
VSGEKVRLLFNIVPEAAAYLGDRSLRDIAKSTVFNAEPDALCVSGLTAGEDTSAEQLRIVKDAVPNTAVFANTGVRVSNVGDQLAVADGAIVGTAFKRDGYIWNEVDPERVRVFMDAARTARGS